MGNYLSVEIDPVEGERDLRRFLAEQINGLALRCDDTRRPTLAEFFYKLATRVCPSWDAPWYNLGLLTKNTGRWAESLRFNQTAFGLNSSNEAACWNLGIAATALRNWSEARRAWKAYGIELVDGEPEVRMPRVTGCVRLDPNGSGEVVWGDRIDPARIVILSVPLPESGRRFRDVILNDGAGNGTRKDFNGREIPVFDELKVWDASPFSTFRVHLEIPDETAEKRLVDLCVEKEIGVEDWSTIRFICAKCSRGDLGPHNCVSQPPGDGSKRFGFASRTPQELLRLLKEWSSANASARFEEPELMLSARPN